MAEVVVSGEIEVPSERLWDLLLDFGSVGWMQGVTQVEVQGSGQNRGQNVAVNDGGVLVCACSKRERRRIVHTLAVNKAPSLLLFVRQASECRFRAENAMSTSSDNHDKMKSQNQTEKEKQG